MQRPNEKNKVILMSILNFIGFGIQIVFSLIAINSTNRLSSILYLIICFSWLSFFSIRGLRAADDDDGSPAADMTAFAWPSFIAVFMVAVIILNFFGIHIQ